MRLRKGKTDGERPIIHSLADVLRRVAFQKLLKSETTTDRDQLKKLLMMRINKGLTTLT